MGSKKPTIIIHNTAIICEDLAAMVAFFVELGMELEGEMRVEGPWMDGVIDIDDAQCDIAMLRTSDGHGRLELSQFIRPESKRAGSKNAPVNTLGMGRVIFTVDDLDAALERIWKHGATVLREVVRYENIYRLCYVRGPESTLVGLAEELG